MTEVRLSNAEACHDYAHSVLGYRVVRRSMGLINQVKVVIVKELTIKDDKRKVQNKKLRYSYVRLWICFRQYTSATSYAYFYCSTVYLVPSKADLYIRQDMADFEH